MATAVALACSVNFAQAQASLSNIRSVTPEGEYSMPKWSPEGDKLLFTDDHNSTIYVMDLKNGSEILEIKHGQGVGYRANWSKDGKSILYREKQDRGSDLKVKSISISTGKEEVREELHPDDLNVASRSERKRAVTVYINQETLKLEGKMGVDGEPWIITPEEGQYYNPRISPDGQYVIVNEGATMYLYPVSGKGSRTKLGFGLASSWLPDGSGVVTFEDGTSDGHTVTESDLYMITVSGRKTRLTNTDNMLEMWGDVAPGGKRIAFSDEQSGRIFIADLNL